jgi:hypothetical protein
MGVLLIAGFANPPRIHLAHIAHADDANGKACHGAECYVSLGLTADMKERIVLY